MSWLECLEDPEQVRRVLLVDGSWHDVAPGSFTVLQAQPAEPAERAAFEEPGQLELAGFQFTVRAADTTRNGATVKGGPASILAVESGGGVKPELLENEGIRNEGIRAFLEASKRGEEAASRGEPWPTAPRQPGEPPRWTWPPGGA